jgi:ubiquinone biosynthesis protein
MLSRYGGMELAEFNIGQIMSEVLGIAERNGLAMPAGVSMLSRGMITMEGVLARLDRRPASSKCFRRPCPARYLKISVC